MTPKRRADIARFSHAAADTFVLGGDAHTNLFQNDMFAQPMTNAPTRAETTAFFAVPVTSLAQAHEFLRSLHAAGLLFHPEDAPADIVDGFGIPLFSDDEITLLEQRMAEIYTFDADPCGFCMDELTATQGA